MLRLVCLILLFISLGCVSRTNKDAPTCSLTLAQAPELRGFRFGMSLTDIQTKFPGFPNIPVDRFGLAKVIISKSYRKDWQNKPGKDEMVTVVDSRPYPELNELTFIELSLVDGKLAKVMVFYPDDLKWKSADEFTLMVTENLKLNGVWKKIGEDDFDVATRWLKCYGFGVTAGLSSINQNLPSYPNSKKYPFIEISNFVELEKVRQRLLQENETINRQENERKDAFKP